MCDFMCKTYTVSAVQGWRMGSRSLDAWVGIWVLPLHITSVSYVSQFPHPCNRDDSSAFLTGLSLKLSNVIYLQQLEQCLTHSITQQMLPISVTLGQTPSSGFTLALDTYSAKLFF